MQVIKIDEGLQEAVAMTIEVLKSGGVIAFPTETTYGLGCDPRIPAALGKIYRIKGREASKALPLVACSMDQVKMLFDIGPHAEKLVASHWPGPLTVLLEPKDLSLRRQMPVFRDGYSAVRASSHPFVQALVCSYGFPLVATSANYSGKPACLSIEDLQNEFADNEAGMQPDLLVDGGVLDKSEPSTIVKISSSGEIEIIRQGAIKL